MEISTRDQFTSIVRRIKNGDVGSKVTITLPGDHELVAMITREDCNDLGLNVGSAVIALIKSTAIIIITDLKHIKLLTRNRLSGLICGVGRGATNSVITVDLGNGLRLTTGVTLQSAERLDLHPGQRATAIFKAGSVMLGVLAQERGINILSVCCKIF